MRDQSGDHPSKHRSLARLAKARARLLAAVADLPDVALDYRPASGWSVREILTHVLNAEEDHTRVISAIARGDLDRIPREFDLDAHNQQRVNQRGALPLTDLLDLLAVQRRRTETLFTGLSEAQRALVGPHPALGMLSIEGIFRVIAIHDGLHTREIEAVLAERAAGES